MFVYFSKRFETFERKKTILPTQLLRSRMLFSTLLSKKLMKNIGKLVQGRFVFAIIQNVITI